MTTIRMIAMIYAIVTGTTADISLKLSDSLQPPYRNSSDTFNRFNEFVEIFETPNVRRLNASVNENFGRVKNALYPIYTPYPPFGDDSDILPRKQVSVKNDQSNSGYDYHPPTSSIPTNQRPQNDEPVQSGYHYDNRLNDQRPQNDVPVQQRPQNPVQEGYHYDKPLNNIPLNQRPQNDVPLNQRPQNDETVQEGYHYDKPLNNIPLNQRPQNDIPANPGYTYQKPQNDQPLNVGYHYEKPQIPVNQRPQNDIPINGYDYQPPQNDLPLNHRPVSDFGYTYQKPVGNIPHNERPQNDQPVNGGYTYQKPGIPAQNDEAVVINGFDSLVNTYLPTKPDVWRDHVQDEDRGGGYLPPKKPEIFQDEPVGSYLPAKKPEIFQDVPVGSYLPPKKPEIFQDIPVNSYLPPKKPEIFQDEPVGSYLPPKKPEIFQDVPVTSYLPANPPAFQNDPPVYGPPLNSYGVPVNSPTSNHPQDSLILEMKRPTYRYTQRDNRQNWFRTAKFNSVQMQVQNMSCLDTNAQHYFKATLKMSKTLENTPVVASSRVRESNCIVDVNAARSTFEINVNGLEKMRGCGIEECSQDGKVHYCLNVRFPTVAGIKLPEDLIMTLQCRTKEKVVSQVKHFTMAPQEIQEKSLKKNVIFGGVQNPINSNIVLLRKNSGKTEFSEVVPFGSSVILGEELLIRASVSKNDGWKFSRLADVTMQKNDRKKIVRILDRNGCRDERMQTVSPFQQYQDPDDPLISTLFFRAFAFNDMNNGEQMMLSVRLLGCLEYQDCFKDWPCQRAQRNAQRTKRNLEKSRNKTIDLHTDLTFNVVIPEPVLLDRRDNSVEFINKKKLFWLPFFVVLLAFFLVLMMFVCKFYDGSSFSSFR